MVIAQLFGLASVQPHATSWEYRIVAPDDEALEDELKLLGDQGWEVVTARRASDRVSASYEMILKRPK